MINILVYGFYGKNNLGDDLFTESFHHLFPQYSFTFTDRITCDLLNGVSAVFFGGGSLLSGAPNIKADALSLLKKKKIFYVGVGVENKIHTLHIELMKIAKLIAIRSANQIFKIRTINSNVYCIPDLVFSLQQYVSLEEKPLLNKESKSVLIMPNIYIVPNYANPYWMHACWEYFKSEFAQFLDILINEKYNIGFFPMCKDNGLHDSWAAIEIMNKMKNRCSKYVLNNECNNVSSISNLIKNYSMVITQRYHGAVLSEMSGVPYLVLSHHDKLKNSCFKHGRNLSYYGVTKDVLHYQFNDLINTFVPYSCLVDLNFFESLKKNINNLINDE